MRYRLDNTFSRGTAALMLWLALVTLILVVVAGLVLAVAEVELNDGNRGFIEGAWASLLRTLDPGTMGGDVGWFFRVVALLVTLGGLFIVSTLIGLISNAINQKLEDLRKGRTPVVESGHTLILGWSPKLMTIIAELMVANENQDYSAIVVMSQEDKVWMEDQIRDRIKGNGKTRVVCRTGDISDPQDLGLVDPVRSKAIIILSPDRHGADAEVIRCVLALMQHDRGLEHFNVVAELTDERNAEALGVATEGRVSTVVSSDIIARITAQVCRQSGLSAVYQELLDFDGDEIYFSADTNVVGKTFAAALHSFETSTVMGLKFADGRIELNPPMDTVLKEGDSVIAIAEDDDKIEFVDPGPHGGPVETGDPQSVQVEEHLMIVGWNFLGPRLLQQLDEYVTEGSTAHILYDPEHVADASLELGNFQRLQVSSEPADTSQEGPLRETFRTREIDHVIVLCYREGLSIAESDARTLMTLLQLRRIVKSLEAEKGEEISIVTELLDVKDVELARVANPDDFVVSEQLASLLITQLSENPDLGPVFADLFDSYESELMLKPATLYLPRGETVTFHDAVASARRFNEIAIGYRKHTGNGKASTSIVINPKKSESISFSDGDHLIVLTTS